MSQSTKYFPISQNDESIRPSTHHFAEAKVLKRKTHTSLKVLRRLPQSSIPKNLDKDLLFKIRPKQISIDKEQLFQENMQLKLKNHSQNEEIIRLKTKFSQLEQEMIKKERGKESVNMWDKSQSLNLASSLRQTVKDLKNSLELKEMEIFKLKSNLKCSRTNELEAELQAYVDECTRLRHHLEETLKIKSEINEQDLLTAQALDALQNDKNHLEMENKALKEEVKELRNFVEDEKKKKKMVVKKPEVNPRAEIQRLKIISASKEKELKEKEKEFKDKEKIWSEKEEKLKQELISFKGKLETANLKFRQSPGSFLTFKPSAPLFFKSIHLCSSKKPIKEILESLKEIKNISQVSEIFKGIPQFKASSVGEIFELFRVKNIEKLHDLVKEWFSIWDYSSANNEPDPSPRSSEPVIPKLNNEKIQIPKSHESRSRSNNSNRSSKPIAGDTIPQPSPSNKNKKKIPTPSSLSSEVEVKNREGLLKSSVDREVLFKMWEKISMSLQINRLSRDEFLNFLPDPLTPSSLSQVLSSEPFNFKPEQSKVCCEALFTSLSSDPSPNLSERITSLFNQNIEDWQIFSQDQEDDFNSDLARIVEKNKSEIFERCQKFDKDSKETVTLNEFKSILNDFADVPEVLWNYCRLLFYSCNEELDQVPYVYFLDNYGKEEAENSSSDEDDQKIASIVRKYIEKIAEKLIEDRLSVKNAFLHTAGFISPEQFKDSLEKLGITKVPHQDFELMMQALQDEDSDEACILIDELEDILANYGVVAEEDGTQVMHSVDKEDETLKIGQEEESDEELDEYSEDYND
jgi:hypothetical protein